jgi:hypothetical protein
MTDFPSSPVTETLPRGVQPMATAPMDGREILGYWSGGKTWEIVYCSNLNERWCNEQGELITPPTHWHPLPDGVAQRQQQLQEAVAAAHAAFEAIPIGYPLQQNGRTIDHTLLNEAKRLCEIAVSDTSTDRTWHEAMADRVLQLKIGGAKNLSCDAVLGLIAFVRDGEGSVAVTSPDREGK